MTLINTNMPPAKLLTLGAEGVEEIDLNARIAGTRAVIFALPGAYTGTCTTAHIPSFIRVADKLRAKGIAHIVCISVNDPFVMARWGDETGADKAGIAMLCDATGDFTRALGMEFDAPAVGLINRSKRYVMVVEDGLITNMQMDENPGVCELSAGEAVLELL